MPSCDQQRLGGKTQCRSSKIKRRRCWQSILSSNLFIRHVTPFTNFWSLLNSPATVPHCIQVRKARLQRGPHPSCSKQAAHAAPATAPGPLPTSHKEVPASLEGHQLASPVQSLHASKPPQESAETGMTPHDCKTPHHSMLPAPGANMLSEAGHAIVASTLKTAGPCSGQEDPIVVTAGHSRQQSNKSMPARRKPGSTTWNTLNFQQAQPSQVLLATHPPPAAHAPSDAFRRHQSSPENDAAPNLAHDANGGPVAHLQHDKYQQPAQTELTHSCLGSASMPSSLPCVAASCAVGMHCHAEADNALEAAHAAIQDKAPFEAAAAAAQTSMALEGSETQPDLHLAPAANQAVSFGTPCASVLHPLGSSAKLEPSVHISQAGPLNAEGASPACENVPDSPGNTFAVSGAHAQAFSQRPHAALPAEQSTAIASCSSQDEQGWHLQLDGAVIALFAQGR